MNEIRLWPGLESQTLLTKNYKGEVKIPVWTLLETMGITHQDAGIYRIDLSDPETISVILESTEDWIPTHDDMGYPLYQDIRDIKEIKEGDRELRDLQETLQKAVKNAMLGFTGYGPTDISAMVKHIEANVNEIYPQAKVQALTDDSNILSIQFKVPLGHELRYLVTSVNLEQFA